MSKPDVWFPLVVGDYLKDTSRLSTEQHGAYLLLLMDYWVNGPPPDDDHALASIARLPLARWRTIRPRILAYFSIVDGVWRQKRADEEIVRWTERKRKFAERGAAGGRAKAASSTSQAAKNDTKGLLKSYPASSSTEVEGLTGHSTLCGRHEFLGPREVRDRFVATFGEAWAASYLDPCGWQDVPERALIPATSYAADKLKRDARGLLADLGLALGERAA